MAEQWAEFEDKVESNGYAQISNALLRSPALSLQAKGLWALLKSYAWQDPVTFPGVQRLRKDTGCSDNTLKKYRDELIKVGLLEVRRRGRGRTNLYIFKSVARFLESHTGAKLESHTGAKLESHTGANNEDSVNEDSVNNTPVGEASASSADFVALLDEELRDATPRLTAARKARYGREFKEHLKKGTEASVLDEAVDRIVERWEEYQLSVEQAIRDNGKPKVTSLDGHKQKKSFVPEHDQWKDGYYRNYRDWTGGATW